MCIHCTNTGLSETAKDTAYMLVRKLLADGHDLEEMVKRAKAAQ